MTNLRVDAESHIVIFARNNVTIFGYQFIFETKANLAMSNNNVVTTAEIKETVNIWTFI